MMLFNKLLAEIEESDLQMLVDNTVREGREVEYKEALTIATEDQKQEFLNDVSSFANATGGHLIYGIKESKEDAGKPIEVCGLKSENPGKRIVDMDIIRTGLEPRLQGISICPVPFPSHEGRVAIALYIPQSFASPHMVKSSGRFYSRNSTGKFPLDVAQLRTAFGLAGAMAERIRSFRTDRLSRISAGEETPALLNEKAPKLVLHLVPLEAFTTTQSFDLKPLYNDPVKELLLKPLMYGDLEQNVAMRFNLDGIVRSVRWQTQTSTTGYTQVFRNGVIETVDLSILGISGWNATQFNLTSEHRIFDGEKYERKLLEAMKRFRELQQFLGITPPVFVMVSFLGVKDYIITHPMFERRFPDHTDPIDRTNLIIPEIMVEDFEGDLGEIMKPIFDTVWNAVGGIGSPNYDTEGKFKFGY